MMDTETKLLYSQLNRLRECIDTAEHLDYTQYCTAPLWKVFYEYERQLKLTFSKRWSSWVRRSSVDSELRTRRLHYTTPQCIRSTPNCIPTWLEAHQIHHKVNVSMMKYAVILKRKKKANVISTKRLTFFSLDDAAHYERNIKQHDPKVISTELIPVFSWKQSSMHWTKNSPFISIRRGKVSIGTMMVLICPTVLSAAINRRLMMQNCTLSTVQRQKRTFETHLRPTFDAFLKKRALLRINNVFLLRIKKCVKK